MKTILESMLSQLLAIQAERENQASQVAAMYGIVEKLEENIRLTKHDLTIMRDRIETGLQEAQYAADQWRNVVALFPKNDQPT